MIGSSLPARRRDAAVLLAAAVLLPPLLVAPAYLVPAPEQPPPIRLPFGREIPAVVPAGPSIWMLGLCLLNALLVAALVVRRRHEPWRWPTTVRWNGVGWFAAMDVWHDVQRLVGIAAFGLSALVAPLLLILLAELLGRRAAARVLGGPRVELAGSTVVFAVPMRGLDWDLWFGREALIVEARRQAVGQHGAALRWSEIAGVQPGRVRTRGPVGEDAVPPYTAGEVILVRGRDGQQWVVPVGSALEAADLVVRAWGCRAGERKTSRRVADPDQRAIRLHQRPVSGRNRLGPGGKAIAAVACAVLGGISLWRVVTGQDGPTGLLGTLAFWTPLLLMCGTAVTSRPRPAALVPAASSWPPVPGWVPIGPPCAIGGWAGSPPSPGSSPTPVPPPSTGGSG